MKTALILPIGLLSASVAIVQAQSPALTTIYNFGAPVGPTNLIAGPNSSLYGAAAGGAFGRGFVYQLSPPAEAGAAWNLTVLYNLTASDGTGPVSLAQGPGGSLFGTTVTDPSANAGTIFEVAPPDSGAGAWSGRTLYAFTGTPDGAVPDGTLAFGPNGEIYGTTQRGGQSGVGVGGSGTVFELTPPVGGGAWSETILHRFTGGTDGDLPDSGVIITGNGSLIGTTEGGSAHSYGTVFELHPPAASGGTWIETVLHSFAGGTDAKAPKAGVILGKNGELYGTTKLGGSTGEGIGTVFQMTPPSSPGAKWTEQVLYSFQSGFPTAGYYPVTPLVMNQGGTLFGTTCCGGPAVYGVVFQLTPPASPDGSWTETVLWGFLGGADGGSPYTGLTFGQGGKLYGTTTGTGVSPYVATVFEVTP